MENVQLQPWNKRRKDSITKKEKNYIDYFVNDCQIIVREADKGLGGR